MGRVVASLGVEGACLGRGVGAGGRLSLRRRRPRWRSLDRLAVAAGRMVVALMAEAARTHV